MALPSYVTIILLVIISFFAFNFAVLTFYLWWKLKKSRQKRQIQPNETDSLFREQALPGISQQASTNTHFTPTSSSNIDSEKFGRTISSNHMRYNNINNYLNREHSNSSDILPLNLINNLESAMRIGNQTQLEKSILELKTFVDKETPLNSAINMLSDAETVLETIQLKKNIDIAMELGRGDVWGIEKAVRAIRSSKNGSINNDLIKLAEKGEAFLRINVNHQQVLSALIGGGDSIEQLQSSISMAEIVGLGGEPDVAQLIRDRKLKLEVRKCKNNLSSAINNKQILDLEAALSACNLLPVNKKDNELTTQYKSG